MLQTILIKEAIKTKVNLANVVRLYNKYAEVESSNIHSFFYDPKKRILRTRFLSGREYEYAGVNLMDFIKLVNGEISNSHGKTF